LEEAEIVFALTILAVPDENGTPVFHLSVRKTGVREELIFEFVRNWLRAKEDNYHSNFRKAHSL